MSCLRCYIVSAWLITTLVLNAIWPSLSQDPCTTPLGEAGQCIHMPECGYLYDIVLNSTNNMPNAETKTYLAQSQCGYDNNQKENAYRVLVCCSMIRDRSAQGKNNSALIAGNMLPQPGACGPNFRSRIYGGNTASIDEFPWMALIRYQKPNNQFGFHCGGSLINTRYVMTAAHCIRNANMPVDWIVYAVRLGEWDLDSDPDCETDVLGATDCAPPHKDVLVESSVMHESFDPTSHHQLNDIALLRLKESVPFSDFIRPICLPLSNELRSRNFENTILDVAGWGQTEKNENMSQFKLKITVKVWNVNECQNRYTYFKANIGASQQLCAGGEDGIDTCRGDSGGSLIVPIIMNNRSYYFAAGIVSYGPKPCGTKDWPGVYTRVGTYIDWIQQQIKA